MGKEQRQLHTCPTCSGARVITAWKRTQLNDHPEVQETLTTEDCTICDGSGQILRPPT